MARVTLSSTRLKVYKYLVDGLAPNAGMTIPNTAKELGLTRQGVDRQAKELEAEGAIMRIPGANSPVLYKRGPRITCWILHIATLCPNFTVGPSMTTRPPQHILKPRSSTSRQLELM